MKKTYLILLIGILLATGIVGGALTDDLVAYYTFDSSGADSYGNYSLSNIGNPSSNVVCKIGNCFKYAKANTTKYFTTSDGAIGTAIGPRNILTVAFWAKTDNYNQNTGYFHINGTGLTGVFLNTFSNTLYERFHYGETPAFDANYAYSDTAAWHYFVMRFDGSYGDLWIDNSRVIHTAYSTSHTFTGNSLEIGLYQSTSYILDGAIDEFAVWKRGLSDAELTSLYNGGNGLQYPFGDTPDSCTQLSAVSGLKQINVSSSNLGFEWSLLTGSEKYLIRRNGTNIINVSTLNLLDGGLNSNTAYNWTVSGVNESCTVNRNGIESVGLLNYTLNIIDKDAPNITFYSLSWNNESVYVGILVNESSNITVRYGNTTGMILAYTNSSYVTGIRYANITGLSNGTKYYISAYATDIVGNINNTEMRNFTTSINVIPMDYTQLLQSIDNSISSLKMQELNNFNELMEELRMLVLYGIFAICLALGLKYVSQILLLAASVSLSVIGITYMIRNNFIWNLTGLILLLIAISLFLNLWLFNRQKREYDEITKQ